MHAQRAEVKSCALCSRQLRAIGSVPTRLGRVQGLLGQNCTKTHRRKPRRAGARVCAGPLRASLPTPGSRALRRPRRGAALMPGNLPGPPPPPAGKRRASRRHAPAAGRAARGTGVGRGRGQRARGGAGREPGTGRAGRPEPSQGAPRGVDSGRCRHPAGEREREARPLAGRASVGQCVRARGVVSARRRAQPPPPNGHVGAQRRHRLLFLILRTGLRGGPPPSASAARPAASASASSCPASGSAARRFPPPLGPGRFSGPAPSRREVYVTGGPGAAAAAARTWTPSTPSTRR